MLLLTEGRDNNILLSAFNLAKSVRVLENYVDSMNVAVSNREVQIKIRDLHYGSRRDALKFFSKRVSCSCLKSMHREARMTQPKMALCYGCQTEKKRVELSVCSRCMVTQFCSRECQVANWHKHKDKCDKYCQDLMLAKQME